MYCVLLLIHSSSAAELDYHRFFLIYTFFFLAIAMIRRNGHDHQAPFWLVVVLVVGISSGVMRQKQATTWPIYLGPPIFLQILSLLMSD